MKYPVHAYAKALVAAIVASGGKHHEEIEENFLRVVKQNGDEGHLQKIVDEAERLLREQNGTRKIVVASARAMSKEADALVKKMKKPGDAIEEKIDPSLIAGIRVTVNDEMQFDGSLKGKLDKLFNN